MAVPDRGDTDGLAEQAGGVAAAVPSDLAHRLLDRKVGLAQQTGQVLGTQRRQVRHRGLAVGPDEDPAELGR